MTEFPLIPHPDFLSIAVSAITATIDRPFETALTLAFQASGDLINVLVPDEVAPGFQDGLWRHSCFEAFLGAEVTSAYTELNLSPSGRYAAYEFESYRGKMKSTAGPTINPISMMRGDEWLELTWLVEFSGLGSRDDWQLGLSAIIEARDRTKSYWALRHAPGPPDFHNRDCFTARLPAPSGR